MRNCKSHISRSIWKLACFLCLITVSTGAQSNTLSDIQNHFIRYQENALQEKIFVHTSKDNFFPGETLFFKLYALDGMFHHPWNLSTVAYFELLTDNNHPIVQLKVPLINGLGQGWLDIPDSLSTGQYRIIAYTSWMRNFRSDFFFTKDITLTNPLKKVVRTDASVHLKSSIRFFPEGGNLVVGLTSKVGFQATSPYGLGIDFKGVILDQENDTLIKFQPNKFGIGNFTFTPAKNKIYRAYIRSSDGSSIIQELPLAFDEGYVMTLQTPTGGDQFKIKIRTNKVNATGKNIHLFIHNRQRISQLITTTLGSSGEAEFDVQTQTLEDGISHITLFDFELRPMAERLFFKEPKQKLQISFDNLKPVYERREAVSLDINTQNQNGAHVASNLSLSVYKIDDIQRYDSSDIVSHLLLTSDLKGKVENPSYYINAINDHKREVVDNLMLTHGWTRFKWEDVLKDNWPVTQFGPDNEGMTIRAKIANELDAPVANANVFLSISGNDSHLYGGKSNAKGIIQFYTHNLYGSREVMIQNFAASSMEKLYVTLLNPFEETSTFRSLYKEPVWHDQEQSIRSYNIHTQVQKAFARKPNIKIPEDTIPFYGKPDKTYIVSDYVSFPQLKDILKEYVFELIVRRKDSKFQFFALDNTTQAFFNNEPFVLFDGVPVFDTDRVISLPANAIKKLDVVNKKFYFGPFVFNGIVSLTSDSAGFLNVQMNPEAMVFNYEGLQANMEFYEPNYDQIEDKEERLPDFRNVLHWKPNIYIDQTGKTSVKFYTSDLKGKYIGVVNGLTENGMPGSATFILHVAK